MKTIKEIAEEVDENFYKQNNYYQSTYEPISFAIQVGIEASKYHVTEALKQAREKAKTKDEIHTYPDSWASPGGGSEIIQVIDKDSILNAYDLNNIK